MKKIIFLFFAIFTYNSISSQIELEKSYSAMSGNKTSLTYSLFDVYETIYSSKVVKYILFDSRDNSLKIFNLDYSLYKSLTITPPSGYMYSSMVLASTKLFNNDDKVEFIICYTMKRTNNSDTTIMKLYDEDLTIVKDFGNYTSAYVVVTSDSKFKLRASLFSVVYTKYPTDYNYSYKMDIYSLGGTVPVNYGSLKSTELASPYPNPAETVINLTYKLDGNQSTLMRIYNSNGQLFEQKQINSAFDRILLNVQSYPSGIYYYEYNGVSNKFIVN